MESRQTPHRPGEPVGLGLGDRVAVNVLGLGRVEAVVEQIDELVQEGVRELAWRIALRLPTGEIVNAIKRGHARLAFLDPRHTTAR